MEIKNNLTASVAFVLGLVAIAIAFSRLPPQLASVAGVVGVCCAGLGMLRSILHGQIGFVAALLGGGLSLIAFLGSIGALR